VADEGAEIDHVPTLREDSRARARSRIIQGASRAVARAGLDATIDEIADEAGVSRRTVFRHFATHGELIAATIRDTIVVVGDRLPSAPEHGEDLQTWVSAAMVQMHETIRELVGRAFWDIHIERTEYPPEVAEVLSRINVQRHRFTDYLAGTAWTSVGGRGDPPRWVTDSFYLHGSGFATFAHPTYSARQTGELSGRILWVVLTSALEQQGSSAPAGAGV